MDWQGSITGIRIPAGARAAKPQNARGPGEVGQRAVLGLIDDITNVRNQSMSDEDKFQPRPRALPAGAAERPPRNRSWLLGAAVLLAVLGWFLPFNSPYPLALAPGIAYTNYHLAEGPWSIHVVRGRACGRPV